MEVSLVGDGERRGAGGREDKCEEMLGAAGGGREAGGSPLQPVPVFASGLQGQSPSGWPAQPRQQRGSGRGGGSLAGHSWLPDYAQPAEETLRPLSCCYWVEEKPRRAGGGLPGTLRLGRAGAYTHACTAPSPAVCRVGLAGGLGAISAMGAATHRQGSTGASVS